MDDRTLDEILEEERKIEALNIALVGEFKKAKTQMSATTRTGDYVPIKFPMNAIPENLRGLLTSRRSVLFGEISADIGDGDGKCYYYVRNLQINENTITVSLMKNW